MTKSLLFHNSKCSDLATYLRHVNPHCRVFSVTPPSVYHNTPRAICLVLLETVPSEEACQAEYTTLNIPQAMSYLHITRLGDNKLTLWLKVTNLVFAWCVCNSKMIQLMPANHSKCWCGHLLMKNYLSTKFEAYGAKHSQVINCTRWRRPTWPLTLTFDLLTWISKGIIYSSRNIYLPSLKLLWQSILESSVAQG